jgi:hypothetical protein
MTTKFYKDFEIDLAPLQVATGEWTVFNLSIRRSGLIGAEKEFERLGLGTFRNPEDAAESASLLGEQIIDGQIPGCTVLDL